MKLVKVKEHAALARDIDSNAVVNVNKDAYFEYMTEKNKILAEKRRRERQDAEINNIKQELNEIKQLLYKIVKNGNDK